MLNFVHPHRQTWKKGAFFFEQAMPLLKTSTQDTDHSSRDSCDRFQRYTNVGDRRCTCRCAQEATSWRPVTFPVLAKEYSSFLFRFAKNLQPTSFLAVNFLAVVVTISSQPHFRVESGSTT